MSSLLENSHIHRNPVKPHRQNCYLQKRDDRLKEMGGGGGGVGGNSACISW